MGRIAFKILFKILSNRNSVSLPLLLHENLFISLLAFFIL